MEDLNNILTYLFTNKGSAFQKRTKNTLRRCSEKMVEIDDHLSKLSRDGYIRSYFHPSIGLRWDHLQLDSDQKIYYSLTERGMAFFKKGGYN
ncbi:MAG: hypothetical protein A3D92_15275 [Bacteroidetes bacterium RIFCSPHIGHO2_02_FULL_44_7]|nr:MAG: hypothetical protein A3D92_15275 [Bacteroidetes bacterium RIFCSPHIGHO2_02_FULL_44_7]